MSKQATVQPEVDRFMSGLIKRNPHEIEFHQAVREVTETLMPSSSSTRNTTTRRSWSG